MCRELLPACCAESYSRFVVPGADNTNCPAQTLLCNKIAENHLSVQHIYILYVERIKNCTGINCSHDLLPFCSNLSPTLHTGVRETLRSAPRLSSVPRPRPPHLEMEAQSTRTHSPPATGPELPDCAGSACEKPPKPRPEARASLGCFPADVGTGTRSNGSGSKFMPADQL